LLTTSSSPHFESVLNQHLKTIILLLTAGRDPDTSRQPEPPRGPPTPECQSLIRLDRGLPQELEEVELGWIHAHKVQRRFSVKRQRTFWVRLG
jgi:hypothetical protein